MLARKISAPDCDHPPPLLRTDLRHWWRLYANMWPRHNTCKLCMQGRRQGVCLESGGHNVTLTAARAQISLRHPEKVARTGGGGIPTHLSSDFKRPCNESSAMGFWYYHDHDQNAFRLDKFRKIYMIQYEYILIIIVITNNNNNNNGR